jgi:hypothetical protein
VLRGIAACKEVFLGTFTELLDKLLSFLRKNFWAAKEASQADGAAGQRTFTLLFPAPTLFALRRTDIDGLRHHDRTRFGIAWVRSDGDLDSLTEGI